MRGRGWTLWAYLASALLSGGLGAAGFWIGGAPGAGVGVAAGVLVPLLIDQVKRWLDAVDAVKALGRDYGPARLLAPDLETVPFAGRTWELKELEEWCLNGTGLVRLVTGGGGSGKTRLALQLCARMKQRRFWRCVWVAERAEAVVTKRARAAAPWSRLLLVVDYAEARKRTDLEDLLTAARRDKRVRVLLLARQAGDWWPSLGAGIGVVQDVVAAASLYLLPLKDDLGPGQTAQEVVRQALPYFAKKLRVPAPDAGLVAVSAHSGPRVLDLHAAALVAVLQSQQQPPGSRLMVDTGMVLQSLLRHEKHYWQGRAEAAELMGGLDGLGIDQLSQVAAVGCLLGISEVDELSERVPGVRVTDAVARWLRDLYPAAAGDELGVLRPDRLAEMHVSQELGKSPALADACLTGLSAAQAQRALVLLARASADHDEARALLKSSLDRFPDVIAGLDAPREAMIGIANAMPYPNAALAESHASIAERIQTTYSPGSAGWAQWLGISAVLRGDLGQPEEALTASRKAVASYRMLAHHRPDLFRRDLAMALNNQSLHLSTLGRREDALRDIDEAAQIYRDLDRDRPHAFLPDLAMALNNQSSCLSDLGRSAEALEAIEEAVAVYNDLADTRSEIFLPALAMALNNQSSCLSDLGRSAEALEAIEEAVAIRRALAVPHPEAFLPDLTRSLSNKSLWLSKLGRREEARAAINESVTSLRALAEELPAAFRPDLATALANRSWCLSGLGQSTEALDAIEEAVDIYRGLADARRAVFARRCADSLEAKATILSSLGRKSEAHDVRQEATDIRKRTDQGE